MTPKKISAKVIEYVTEEVTRQGHDVASLDGIKRVGWMLNGWSYALLRSDRPPFLDDAVMLGKLVEADKNLYGIRKCKVWVGQRECPHPDLVPKSLELLFERRDGLSPLEFYKQFEEVHPFIDGNGRTGKILLNWVNGTLLEPIFPPNDLWGRWIVNP